MFVLELLLQDHLETSLSKLRSHWLAQFRADRCLPRGGGTALNCQSSAESSEWEIGDLDLGPATIALSSSMTLHNLT